MKSYMRAFERLGKWRAHFAGWQLGTRLGSDPEVQAVRDLVERTLLLRAEVSALTAILIEKGVCTFDEMTAHWEEEAEGLMKALEERWPGAQATDDGMSYTREAVEWMSKWKP